MKINLLTRNQQFSILNIFDFQSRISSVSMVQHTEKIQYWIGTKAINVAFNVIPAAEVMLLQSEVWFLGFSRCAFRFSATQCAQNKMDQVPLLSTQNDKLYYIYNKFWRMLVHAQHTKKHTGCCFSCTYCYCDATVQSFCQ